MRTTLNTRQQQAQRQSARRQLFVESLEHRQVLAGNVLATMVGGNLMIRGDSVDNGIEMTYHADGSVEVGGVQTGEGATTINGSSVAFVAEDVRSMTRVSLGAGDDALTIHTEAATDTNSGDNTAAADSGRNFLLRNDRLAALRNGANNPLANFGQRDRLLINTGPGADTVDATVAANVRVDLAGNRGEDDISIVTLGEDGASVEFNADTAAAADIDVAVNVNSELAASDNLNLDTDVSLDVATAADLDTVLTANLVTDPALNSAANLGTSALFNVDNNLNGAVGGTAAANLLGEDNLSDIRLQNLVGSSNLSVDDAATLALMSANSFNLAATAADDFFADLGAQNQVNLNNDLSAQAGLFGSLGNDALGNGALNSNINAAVSGAFQSRFGTVPLG